MERGPVCQGRLGLAVDGHALGIDHPPQKLIAYAEPARRADQANAIAASDAGRLAERVEQGQVVTESDHLGRKRHVTGNDQVSCTDFGNNMIICLVESRRDAACCQIRRAG